MIFATKRFGKRKTFFSKFYTKYKLRRLRPHIHFQKLEFYNILLSELVYMVFATKKFEVRK